MTLDTAVRARLMRDLATVCAIPVTPFHPDGEVDWDGYRRTVIAIADGGVSVLTPNGNTGEFYALTREECDRAVAVTGEAVGDRTLVMPGVGYDVRTAIALGEAARRAGARAVMVHQPVHPYQSADGWVAYHAEIARALPDLGIVPYLRDPNVTAAMLTRLTEYPNFVGVKFAVPNPLHFAAVASAVGLDRSIEYAAVSLGASEWTVLRRITLPLVAPGLISGWALAFINSFDEVTMTV